MDEKKCLLSVAMIVKDEEHNIRRALESVKDVVDEIIVVDTGSKDRTPEIAREYTNKVYFHKWKNDFSEARNYSLKFPTCEWVLILDADEEIDEYFKDNIRSFLKRLSQDVNTVYVPTLSYLDWDFKMKEVASTPRIFRNGTVHYENIVHNQPIYKPEVVEFPGKVIHYGYIWTRQLRKRKYERTKNLILKHLQKVKDPMDRIYYLVQLFKTESIGMKHAERMALGFEILNEIKKMKRVPSIALEFLYMFGSICAQYEYYDLAFDALEIALNSYPDYPDPYFGMILLYERKDDPEKLREWSVKYLRTMEKALKKIESFHWTIMSMKYLQLAWFFKAYSELRLARLDDFKKSVKKAIEFRVIEDVSPILSRIVKYAIHETNKKEFLNILDTILQIHEFARKNNIVVPIDEVLERIVKEKLESEIEKDVVEKLMPMGLVGTLIKKKLVYGGDYLLDLLIPDGKLGNFVSRYNVPGLLFLYEILLERGDDVKNILKFLNLFKDHEDRSLKGIAQALIADNLLKLGNFTEAIRYYRKSLELVPELKNFIKEIVDDLKSKPSRDIEGVYDEILKFYMKYKEFMIDFKSIFHHEVLKSAYMVSDIPIAKYMSAILLNDPEISIKLLEEIPENQRRVFPMYYHRLAQFYKKIDLEKSLDLYQKSLMENIWLADIIFKKFPFNGIYPALTGLDFMGKNDEIVWVENISERFSTLGIIHPLRIWKKSKIGFKYTQPFPTDEAIKLYYKREKEFMKSAVFEPNKQDILRLLAKNHIHSVNFISPDFVRSYDEYVAYFEENGVEISQDSENVLVVKANILREKDFREILVNYRKGIIVLSIPNSETSDVWYYPPFRIIRSFDYLTLIFKKIGVVLKDCIRIGEEMFAICFEKGGI